MAKKNELLNSFSASRKQKAVLAADDIDRIAESVEKPQVVELPKVAEKTPSVKTAPKIAQTPQSVKVAKVVKTKTVAPVQVVPEPEPQMEFVKTSLDFPVDVYEDMKITLFRKRRSMKDYIVELVKQDLYGKK